MRQMKKKSEKKLDKLCKEAVEKLKKFSQCPPGMPGSERLDTALEITPEYLRASNEVLDPLYRQIQIHQ